MHMGKELKRRTCVSEGKQTLSLALGILDLWNRGCIFKCKNKVEPIVFYRTGKDFFKKQHETGESNQNQIKNLVKDKKNCARCRSLLVWCLITMWERSLFASFVFSSAGIMGNNKWNCDGNVI